MCKLKLDLLPFRFQQNFDVFSVSVKVDTNGVGGKTKPPIVRARTSYVNKQMKFWFPAEKKTLF